MFMRRAQPIFVLVAVFFVWTGSNAQSPNLGMPIEEQDIAAWDIDILPDGTGLPSGQGSAEQGEIIYAQKCAVCHGVKGEGGISPALAGGEPLSNGIDTGKTIGNFWPYATTIFDYTRRAMPWFAPRTLTDDEVYALTAYLLVLNNIISNEDVMNADALPAVQMPNRDGFIVRFPERTP